VCENHTLRVKSHSAYGNRTLRVVITLVRVVITLVRVVITFVSVTLERVIITVVIFTRLRACNIHTACGN
jgi:hypothetical protein